MSAKNLPVISKLRQKVPPVLAAVNMRLPLHKNDLKRRKACSVGLLPCKDIEINMFHKWGQVFRGSSTANSQGKLLPNVSKVGLLLPG